MQGIWSSGLPRPNYTYNTIIGAWSDTNGSCAPNPRPKSVAFRRSHGTHVVRTRAGYRRPFRGVTPYQGPLEQRWSSPRGPPEPDLFWTCMRPYHCKCILQLRVLPSYVALMQAWLRRAWNVLLCAQKVDYFTIITRPTRLIRRYLDAPQMRIPVRDVWSQTCRYYCTWHSAGGV